MAGRSIILYAGSGGYILQETTAAVVNIRTQLCFVVIAGHNVITLFKHQRGRAAGIPGRYIIPIAFICAFIKKLVFVSYFIILKQTFAYIVYLNTVRCLPGLTDPQS